jgi:hypothetical protein
MNDLENHFFVCACWSDEHILRFTYDPEDNHLWAGIFLRPQRWFVRLWVALKYVFGYQCKYGAFDSFIFDSKDAGRMTELMERIKVGEQD